MYTKVLLVSAFVALAGANDLFDAVNNTTKGHNLLFRERFQAQWAMTRQTKDVFVNSSNIITGINVTDLREGKDGEAKIVSGGVGHDNVTISLMSPAVFRGFDFLVEVYSDGAELGRGQRGMDTEPQLPQKPDKPDADKPVTPLPVGTGVPAVTPLPVGATGFPNVTQKPIITGKPTEATHKPVTGLPIGTGMPDAAKLPTVTPVDKLSSEEMDFPEEVEQEPKMPKRIGDAADEPKYQ